MQPIIEQTNGAAVVVFSTPAGLIKAVQRNIIGFI
jgi:hypothetical protein